METATTATPSNLSSDSQETSHEAHPTMIGLVNRIPIAVLLAVFALASLFSSGKWAVPAAAWLAPLIGLRIMRTSKRAAYGFLGLFVIGTFSQLIAWQGAIPLPAPIFVATIAIGTLAYTLVLLIDRLVAPRIARDGKPLFISTLVFPFAGTALELVALNDPTIGSFASSGYAQYGFTAFTQSIAIVGITGLVFLVLWTASVVNWAWERDFDRARLGYGVAVWGGAILLVMGFGAFRLASGQDSGQTVPVASFTAHEMHVGEMLSLHKSDPGAFREETRAIHADYLAQTRTYAEEGARIVTWPEIAGIGVTEDVDALLAAASDVARENNIYLAVPVFEIPSDPDSLIENRAHLFDDTGAQIIEHVKYGGNALEGTLAGDQELQVVDSPYGRLSIAICWDADYPSVIAQAGRQDVDILLSPALEYEEIDPLHAEIAAFRAVENGMSVIRQTDQGLSMVSDPYGRMIATADHFTDAERVVRANVRTNGVPTVYPYLGDLVGLISVLGLALTSMWAVGSKVAQVRKQRAARR